MTGPSRLAEVLASRPRALWGPEVEVVDARPLPGGASRESWDVRVRTAGDARIPVAEAIQFPLDLFGFIEADTLMGVTSPQA